MATSRPSLTTKPGCWSAGTFSCRGMRAHPARSLPLKSWRSAAVSSGQRQSNERSRRGMFRLYGVMSYAESHMKKMLLAITACSLLAAQEKVDSATDARFRSEELEKSQIMQTLHMLTDRYGPRVTGTPGHEAAAKWAVKQLTDWGLKNARLEPWDFGHPGWSNERASAFLVSPAQAMVNLNLLAPFLISREAAKLMRKSKSGRIINVSSMAVSLEPEGDSVYAACKAALTTLSNIMAKEFAS